LRPDDPAAVDGAEQIHGRTRVKGLALAEWT
jgi:hypothetical protein